MNKEEKLNKDIEEFLERKDKVQENINKEKCFNEKVKKECLEFIILQNDLILRLLSYQIGRGEENIEK